MNDVLDAILATVQSVDPVLRSLIAAVGMLFETSILLGLVIPGDSIVIVASTAVTGVGDFALLAASVIVGSLAGESIGFALGHHFGPRIRASRLGARIGEQNWARAERYVERRGGIAIFISRFLPVLHSVVPLTVGMSSMNYRRFITWTAPSCAIWALAYVSFGTFAAGGYREISDRLHYAGYLFAGVLILFVVLAIVARKIIHRSQERHMGHPAD